MEIILQYHKATLASAGTAGVPGVGVINVRMVLVQIVPLEGIGLVMGIDRICWYVWE